MNVETPTLDAAVAEIAQLKEAAKLLGQVYLAVGPYPTKEKGVVHGLSYIEEPWSKVRDFFGFDDSE